MFKELSAGKIRERKFLKKGLQLSIMVVGETGIGKATFVNTLCGKNVLPVGRTPQRDQLIIENHEATISGGNTTITLDVVLVSGLGDFVNNSQSTEKVVKYLEDQYEASLQEECKIQRTPHHHDSRVHAALYFIRPTGKGLRALDIKCMKDLSKRCNVIPIISKSDMLNRHEKALNKSLIMRQIKEHQIEIYDPSQCFEDVDGEFDGASMVPFSVVAGTDKQIIAGVQCNVRKLAFGVVNIDDPDHSDFGILKTCLFGACLQDLKDLTDDYYYESYRTERLTNEGGTVKAEIIPPEPISSIS